MGNMTRSRLAEALGVEELELIQICVDWIGGNSDKGAGG